MEEKFLKAIKIEARTDKYRIFGSLHLPHKSYKGRLSDLLNEKGLFLALTDVSIYEGNSQEALYKCKFVALRKDSLDFVIPLEE